MSEADQKKLAEIIWSLTPEQLLELGAYLLARGVSQL